jgi:hypothetical protein
MSMRKKISPRITVAIVGTDPVIGRVLESLLQTAGYGTRFVTYPVTSESCNMVADAHVVLLLPGLSNISREGCPISEVSTAATNIPILELIPEPDEVPSFGHARCAGLAGWSNCGGRSRLPYPGSA